ncbi:hypothetical protein PVL29_020652 [Vitis rotundifolia]|uniref:Uncharacterized protein n=1 Tax=Vitis rotundifolia TaxID=103349 RepID=A0AA38YXN0_VITRO|nr:hypothetical protein PVL29_020652 [Vitis rotundifolia]
MTKKGSLTITHNYSLNNLHVASGDQSYVDKELVQWKGREFEYKNTLGLVKSIDLSSNKLTGEIPKEVTDLLELVSLNFSRNNLTGLIPTTIGQLKSLDVLDLSQNQLIGEIPSSLSEIDHLSTQLQSFNSSAYEGNPTLCGLPLLKKCPEDRAEGAPNASSYEDNIQQDGNDMWFYLWTAPPPIVATPDRYQESISFCSSSETDDVEVQTPTLFQLTYFGMFIGLIVSVLEGKDYGKMKTWFPDYTETTPGLQYKDLRVGTGPAPKVGEPVVFCNAHIYMYEHPKVEGLYICSSHNATIYDLADLTRGNTESSSKREELGTKTNI